MCRLPESSIEKQLARRQLSIKGDKSNSWYIAIKDILLKYDLPHPWELLEAPPTRLAWKHQVRRQVDDYWVKTVMTQAALYSSLTYLQVESYKPEARHPIIREAQGVKDVPRIHTKSKIVTGSYVLQVNRASFNQNQVIPTCMLCKNENETVEHFMLRCTELDLVIQPILDDIAQVSQRFGIAIDRENSEEFLQLLLYSTAILPDRYKRAGKKVGRSTTSRNM